MVQIPSGIQSPLSAQYVCYISENYSVVIWPIDEKIYLLSCALRMLISIRHFDLAIASITRALIRDFHSFGITQFIPFPPPRVTLLPVLHSTPFLN